MLLGARQSVKQKQQQKQKGQTFIRHHKTRWTKTKLAKNKIIMIISEED